MEREEKRLWKGKFLKKNRAIKNCKAFDIAPMERMSSEEQVLPRGLAFTFSLRALVLLLVWPVSAAM